MNKPICKVNEFGTKSWFLNGEYHREDGPAVECTNGNKFWYLNNLRHREDGPAVEYVNGTKYWFLNGKEYLMKDFYKELYSQGKITEEQLFIEVLVNE